MNEVRSGCSLLELTIYLFADVNAFHGGVYPMVIKVVQICRLTRRLSTHFDEVNNGCSQLGLPIYLFVDPSVVH